MPNPQNLGPPFKPNDPVTGKKDPRINRLGKPKSFEQLRKLAQKILGEAILTQDGETISRVEAMLRLTSLSRDTADRRLMLEYAYGKPPDKIEEESTVHHRYDEWKAILDEVYGKDVKHAETQRQVDEDPAGAAPALDSPKDDGTP